VADKEVKRRPAISLSHQTKAELDSIKRSGQSYDGLIKELVKFWREKQGEYWTRRRGNRG